MAVKDLNTIKRTFATGKRPTAQDFRDMIDTVSNGTGAGISEQIATRSIVPDVSRWNLNGNEIYYDEEGTPVLRLKTGGGWANAGVLMPLSYRDLTSFGVDYIAKASADPDEEEENPDWLAISFRNFKDRMMTPCDDEDGRANVDGEAYGSEWDEERFEMENWQDEAKYVLLEFKKMGELIEYIDVKMVFAFDQTPLMEVYNEMQDMWDSLRDVKSSEPDQPMISMSGWVDRQSPAQESTMNYDGRGLYYTDLYGFTHQIQKSIFFRNYNPNSKFLTLPTYYDAGTITHSSGHDMGSNIVRCRFNIAGSNSNRFSIDNDGSLDFQAMKLRFRMRASAGLNFNVECFGVMAGNVSFSVNGFWRHYEISLTESTPGSALQVRFVPSAGASATDWFEFSNMELTPF